MLIVKLCFCYTRFTFILKHGSIGRMGDLNIGLGGKGRDMDLGRRGGFDHCSLFMLFMICFDFSALTGLGHPRRLNRNHKIKDLNN